MKKIFITLFFIAGLLLVSCENEETANVSSVTDYPLVEVIGSNPILVQKGSVYTDPGAKATEGGNTIPYKTSASGTYKGGSSLNTNIIDGYVMTYTAVNKDGFSASATRNVWVYNNGDLINSIEGLYTSTVVRGGSSTAQYTDMEFVLIWKNADGKYQLSCGLGGYYDIGRAYGPNFAGTPAIITAINIPANNFTISNFTVPGFGGNVVMTGFTVNPTTKTITFTSTWDGSGNGTFKVTLTQVQP
jgi:hypothetical protein